MLLHHKWAKTTQKHNNKRIPAAAEQRLVIIGLLLFFCISAAIMNLNLKMHHHLLRIGVCVCGWAEKMNKACLLPYFPEAICPNQKSTPPPKLEYIIICNNNN
jgi:hypothetical protein